MKLASLSARPGTAKRPRSVLLGLLATASALLVAPSALLQIGSPGPPAVFELELPEFGISPSSRAALTIPSSNVSPVFLNILRTHADNVDYSAIRTSVNGQATATISEIGSGARGKLVRI